MNTPTPAIPSTLSVFVSSPGNLKEMREVARTVILEMSGILRLGSGGARFGVRKVQPPKGGTPNGGARAIHE